MNNYIEEWGESYCVGAFSRPQGTIENYEQTHIWDIKIDDPNQFYYRSDHFHFVKNNVPAIFYFSGVHEDYHKPTDTADKILYGVLEKRIKLIFHTAWELANRDERIKLNQFLK